MTEPRQDGDETLRAAYDEAVAAGVGASAGGASVGAHPSPEALQALVERQLPEAERLAMLDHVAACAECSQEMELLRAVAHAGGRLTRESSAFRARRTSLALAAGLALMVTGGVLAKRQLDRDDVPDVTRSLGFPLTVSVATGADARVSLHWRPVAGALRYDVELLANDRTLTTGSTTDTTFAVPDSIRLTPGDPYQYLVTARLRDGTALRSGLGELRATRP